MDLDGLIAAALSPRAMHARVVQYLVEQAGSGRRLADALGDPFVVNRTTPGERRGLLEDARLVGAWQRSTLSAIHDAAPGGDAERRLLRSAHAALRRRIGALRRACAALDERRGREAVALLDDALPPLRADLQARLAAEAGPRPRAGALRHGRGGARPRPPGADPGGSRRGAAARC